jgi:hypothetical protein
VLWLSPIISATWEEEIGEMWFEGSSDNKKKKLVRAQLKKTKNKLGMVVCNPCYMGRHRLEDFN